MNFDGFTKSIPWEEAKLRLASGEEVRVGLFIVKEDESGRGMYRHHSHQLWAFLSNGSSAVNYAEQFKNWFIKEVKEKDTSFSSVNQLYRWLADGKVISVNHSNFLYKLKDGALLSYSPDRNPAWRMTWMPANYLKVNNCKKYFGEVNE